MRVKGYEASFHCDENTAISMPGISMLEGLISGLITCSPLGSSDNL